MDATTSGGKSKAASFFTSSYLSCAKKYFSIMREFVESIFNSSGPT
jgi:hypothetical protein